MLLKKERLAGEKTILFDCREMNNAEDLSAPTCFAQKTNLITDDTD